MNHVGKVPVCSGLSVGSAGAGPSPLPRAGPCRSPQAQEGPSTLSWTPLPPLWVRMGPSGSSRMGWLLGRSLALGRTGCSPPPDPDWTQHPGPAEDRTQRPAPSRTAASRPQSFLPGPHSLCQDGRSIDAEGHGDGEQGRGERARCGGELHHRPGHRRCRHHRSLWTSAPANGQRP